jgi:hypothetical protein
MELLTKWRKSQAANKVSSIFLWVPKNEHENTSVKKVKEEMKSGQGAN